MQTNDILDVSYVIETGGVQTTFQQSWNVDTFLGPDSDIQIMTDHATALWDTLTDVMGANVTFSCLKMINVTTPKKVIVFPNLVGTGAGGVHPPHQAVRVDLYGEITAGGGQWKNANNFSGIIESLSDRGRVNDATPFDDVLSFFSANQQTGANGAILRAQIKRHLGAQNYTYYDVNVARLCEKFEVLRSRKFELCV